MFRKRYLFVLLYVMIWSCYPGHGQNKLISEYLDDLKYTRTDTGRAIVLNNLASQYFEYDINAVNKYALQAKDISDKAHFKKGIGRSLVNMAGFHIRKANYNVATDDLFAALPYLREAHDTTYLIRLYNSLGAIDFSLGQTNATFENDKKAIGLARRSHDKKNELLMLKNMTNSYVVLHDYKNGLTFGNQALVLARQLKSEKDSAYIYDNIGLCYVGMQQYDTGRYYLSQSLKMDERMGYKRQSIVCLTNIAESYAYQENLKESLHYYDLALDDAQRMRDTQFVSMIQLAMGQVYNHIKKFPEAIRYFSDAIEGLKNSQNYNSLGDAYLYMAESYSALGNFKKAYEFQKRNAAIQDSIHVSSNRADIEALENKYEIKKKQDEIAMLTVSKNLKVSQLEKQRFMIYALIAGGILVLVLIIVVLNRARMRQRIKLLKYSAELEKKALQLQMNPHFIFNALGSVSGFIASNDKANALKYLAKFSRLIRYTLDSSTLAAVPLDDEIENLNNYLELEKMRFNNRFNYSIQVASGLEHHVKIPPMIIQPFLENAILHGIRDKEEEGFIRVVFSQADDKIICIVEDNGIGLKKASEISTGNETRQSLGIDITRKRLNIINAAKKSFPSIIYEDLSDNGIDASGTRVTIQFYPN